MKVLSPNFFLIGAMKAGTTSLYHMLSEHPDIYFPTLKEPHYFVNPGTKLKYNGKDDQMIGDQIFVHEKGEYLNMFEVDKPYKIRGDASAMYLYYPKAAENIFHFNSDARVLVVLRNPVDRAYSSYLHLVRDNREHLSFNEALELEELRISKGYNPLWHYKSAGMYSSQISAYLKLFRNIKVVIYEEFKERPAEVLEEICDFLGLDKFNFDLNKRYNASGIPKSKFVHEILRKPNRIKSAFKGLIPESIRLKVRNQLVNLNLGKAEQMNIETRQMLIDYFESDIIALESILDRNLNIWRS